MESKNKTLSDLKVKAMWREITDLEKRASKTKSPMKKSHLIAMAKQIRWELPTNDESTNNIKSFREFLK